MKPNISNDRTNIYKIPLFTALAGLLICIPLRIYQYFKIIEPETGFYNSVDFSVYAIYTILAIIIAVSIAIPLCNNKKLPVVSQFRSSPVLLIISILFTIAISVDSAYQIINYFWNSPEAIGNKAAQQYINLLLPLQSVFGVLSAIYFFVNGLSVSVGSSYGSKYKILALSPVVWCVFRLLYRFKRTISFANVSDLMLELFAIVFLMLFFLAFAQVVSKVDANAVYWKIYAYGIPAAVLSILCFVPRFIVTIIGKQELLNEHYALNYSDIAVSVYIIYNLIIRAKSKHQSEE